MWIWTLILSFLWKNGSLAQKCWVEYGVPISLNKYLAALWNAVGKKIGGFPKAPVLMVIEKDEIAETQKTKQNTHGFHGFPVKRDNKKEVSTLPVDRAE